uniref:Chorismate synthase n=2 Tax=Candidatus Bipolaricaulota TaxID=67810 RepID=H5SF68_9BACT|nr:chorismate synthase [uncultured Acetothermia bacterium]BAL59884.1 chorismate synthase [Candidatus Acetothermum autotrophicum]
MITIRPLQTLDELHACEQLQKEIWGFEDISVVPHHLLLTTIKNGGILLGAFEGERLIGFVYGFPGIEDNKLKHCSLMCAVRSERRFQGVGYELKLKQREAVLAQGIELITWTFDPLVSPNAHFNLHKLGVISNKYERNLYGDMRDRLNAGLETDRLTVEWWITSPRVQRRLQHEQRTSVSSLPVINQTEERNGFLVNLEYSLQCTEPKVLLEIPYHWQRMREQNMPLVKEWRHQTREIFEHYFAQGYYASDFLVTEDEGRTRAFYLLEKTTKEALLQR